MTSIFFEYVRNHWKNVTILVLLAALAICSNQTHVTDMISKVTKTTSTAKVVASTKSQLKSKQVEVVKPDGTKITTTEVAVDSGTVTTAESNQSSSSNESRSAPDSRSSKSRYSVDIAVRPLAYRQVGLTLGARLGTLPVFATIGYVADSIYIGLRGEL